MKLNLTEKLVQDYVITEGKRQEVLFDFELPRFGVSVTARGAKSYVIVYRDTEGKQRQEKLADFGAITLSAARAVAKSRLEVIEAMKSPLGRRRSSCPTMDTFILQDIFAPGEDPKPLVRNPCQHLPQPSAAGFRRTATR